MGRAPAPLHLRRMGWQRLLSETRQWFTSHSHSIPDPTLSRIFHENLFFNYFYAQSLCLDQPELALMTSRSRSYYVCAAYWARDACLWSFPGLVLVDRRQAGRALQAMLTRYLPNAAQHAQYLNGQSLYPGFELDQACAPLIALEHYLQVTGKRDLLQQPWLPAALSLVYESLSEHFDPQTGLYSTFLTPHDDPTAFPYLTYNNVLVWRALQILADLDEVGANPLSQCLAPETGFTSKKLFAAAPAGGEPETDYPGKVRPPGTLRPAVRSGGGCGWRFRLDRPARRQLEPVSALWICSADDPLYLNSLQWIYSEHNPHYYPGPFGGAGAAHFPFPSTFDLANRLLRKDPAAVELLKQLKLDQGLACELFDPQTGVVRTGAAFATLAGFLAYAISRLWT